MASPEKATSGQNMPRLRMCNERTASSYRTTPQCPVCGCAYCSYVEGAKFELSTHSFWLPFASCPLMLFHQPRTHSSAASHNLPLVWRPRAPSSLTPHVQTLPSDVSAAPCMPPATTCSTCAHEARLQSINFSSASVQASACALSRLMESSSAYSFWQRGGKRVNRGQAAVAKFRKPVCLQTVE